MSNAIAAPGSRVVTVNLPAKEQLDAQAAGVLATVETMEIDSDCMMIIAAEELTSLKSGYKQLEAARQLHVQPLNNEVKYINNWFRDALAKMEQAEGALKRKMLTYQSEQEQKRRTVQARVEAELQAERARLVAKEEADPQQRAADEITAIVMTASVVSSPPKLAGISTRGRYKGKVTNLLALVRFIAKHPEHVNLVKADGVAINRIAKAQRGACNIEGILVYEEKSLAARSA